MKKTYTLGYSIHAFRNQVTWRSALTPPICLHLVISLVKRRLRPGSILCSSSGALHLLFALRVADAVWDPGGNVGAWSGATWQYHPANHGKRTSPSNELIVPERAGLGHLPGLHERAGVRDPGVRVFQGEADLLKHTPSWTGAPLRRRGSARRTQQLPSNTSNCVLTVLAFTKKLSFRIIFTLT